MKHVYFPGLNTLRLYAALCVVLSHVTSYTAPDLGFSINFFTLGGFDSVTLFFVLSGFLITYLLLAEQRQTDTISLSRFYKRRSLRILPLYYLIIILNLIFFPAQDNTNYLALVFLSPHLVLPFIAEVGLGQLWSIGVEEYFYLAWPWLVKHFSLIRVSVGIIVIRLSLALIWPALLVAESKYPAEFGYGMMFLRYIHFEAMAVGALGAWLAFHRPPMLKILYKLELYFYLVTLLIIVLPFDGGILYDFAVSLIFTGLILCLSTKPKPLFSLETKITRQLGQVTYGIYMYHGLVMNGLIRTGLKEWPLIVATVVTTIAVALLSYRIIETPFLRLKDRPQPVPAVPSIVG